MPTPQEKPTAVLIVNPAAGRAEFDLEALRAQLEPHVALTVLSTVEDCDADVCARRAIERRPDLVIAGGRRGTVSMVAGVPGGTDAPLAILPSGTSNSIAAGLGIPSDPEGALETLLRGEARAIDTAQANGRPMLLHASAGYHATTIAGTAREAKNRWGILAYWMEGLVNLGDLEPFDVTIETESKTIRCRAVNVAVANVAPQKTVLAQGPAHVSPADGELDVTLVSATSIPEAIATGIHLLTTTVQGEPARGTTSASSPRGRSASRAPPPSRSSSTARPRARAADRDVPARELARDAAARRGLRAGRRARRAGRRAEKLDGLPSLEIEPKP